ncbi:MAG: hypothetical protein M1830_010743 [Pleopsidium flavum]|nr:MAG: hypothetical protein M1830_001700 [Pleopsidium flavum]KAI9873660.1 MAG: hypothetical protein M1830_010743 [Pleopsidium flavum]
MARPVSKAPKKPAEKGENANMAQSVVNEPIVSSLVVPRRAQPIAPSVLATGQLPKEVLGDLAELGRWAEFVNDVKEG